EPVAAIRCNGAIMKIAIGILAALVAFVLWRLSSVARGAAKRDGEIAEKLAGLQAKLEQDQSFEDSEVQALGRSPETRPSLFGMLEHFEKLESFPAQWLEVKEQGRAVLAYWMMHPNELGSAPESIEFVQEFERPVNGEAGGFRIYKFQMAEGHWSNREELLGIAGPFLEGQAPFAVGAFSRSGDKDGSTDLEELVTWYMGLLRIPAAE
ncbi:MAG: hypothetical protein P1V35_17115, partial [Planctomycetota bacterium]|nr:hypothetical protein [Planctomycetota bacterium]